MQFAPTHLDHPIWKGLGPEPYFYYVHSYFPECAEPEVVACTTEYGRTFHGAVTRGRLFATQFHPENLNMQVSSCRALPTPLTLLL